MYLTIPQIGYLLLYFLKVHGQHEYSKSLSASSNQQSSNSKQNNLIKGAVYKDFSLTIEKKLDTSLLNDLKLCQEDNGELLLWLTPEVYREFKTVTINNIAILHIIVQTVDAGQLQDLVCHILQGRLVMFKNETLQPLLLASLMWETFEQYALWQLIAAHDVPLENVLPILPKLDFKSHAEALTSILLRLKQEEPTADLLKLLFCREVRAKGDMFVISVLKYWCLDYEDKLGDLLSNLLNTRNPGTSPNKRKRLPKSGISSQGSPSIEQVLGHLDVLRLCCRHCGSGTGTNLYSMETVQRALQQAHTNSSESQKKQFSELFALAEPEESTSPGAGRGSSRSVGGRGKKSGGGGQTRTTSRKNVFRAESDSSSDSSEEEEVIKPKQAKRRKKALSDTE
uniref:Putative conserved secreted protein n=1 Tax=Xenopsylla cheopis TaxID=163159 RepID=A0A6M2DXT3_XENCH